MNRVFEMVRLMRPQQWIKNLFVFTGLLFGHAWNNSTTVLNVVMAAGAFCLMSSCIYIINDIADRASDRLHPIKKNRPLAHGSVSPYAALLLALFLFAAAAGLGHAAAREVLALLLIYAALNLAYSYGLKHVVILDVFIIAAGFMLRILAGTSGVGIPPSQWLLLCGLMATLFLGFAKRRAEIHALDTADNKGTQRKVLEQYSAALLDKMIGITAAGVIMSYSLYTMSPETIAKHGTPNLIYTVPFVMYGVFRYIYLLHQRQKGEDPSRELLLDPHIFVTVCAWLGTIVMLIA